MLTTQGNHCLPQLPLNNRSGPQRSGLQPQTIFRSRLLLICIKGQQQWQGANATVVHDQRNESRRRSVLWSSTRHLIPSQPPQTHYATRFFLFFFSWQIPLFIQFCRCLYFFVFNNVMLMKIYRPYWFYQRSGCNSASEAFVSFVEDVKDKRQIL